MPRVFQSKMNIFRIVVRVMQFDRFGTFAKAITVDTLSNFQVKENAILYLKGSSWKQMSLSGVGSDTVFQFTEQPLQVSQGNKILAVLKPKGFEVYLMEKTTGKTIMLVPGKPQ